MECSWLFLTGSMIVCLGICVLGISLGTLAITSSFVRVFPFGAPLWTGTLFLILGCFMFIAYRPSKFLVPASRRNRVKFTLVVSVVGALECLLAISLFLWYRLAIYPALEHCNPNLSLQPATACECTSGFIDPPSLRTTIHQFVGVSDCSSFGYVISTFHWALFSLYGAGVVLSVLAGVLAARRLYLSGMCGKSGVYAVTPQPTTPLPDMVSQQPFVASPAHLVPTAAGASQSAPNLPGFTLNQRCPVASSQATLSTYSHSPSALRAQPPRLRYASTSTSSPSHTIV